MILFIQLILKIISVLLNDQTRNEKALRENSYLLDPNDIELYL
jgi:hypothetical protein